MSSVALFYTSHDGHTRSIAQHLERALVCHDVGVRVYDLSKQAPGDDPFANAGMVVVLSPVRYGRPLRQTDRFIAMHHAHLRAARLALLLVSLTARKPEKRHLATSVYLRNWVARHKLAPQLVEGIAGKLDYPSYGWFDRQMIRFIMRLTGGPTDRTACITFTDWQQVDDLANRIAALSQDA